MTDIDLVTPYKEFFKIIPADSPDLRDAVFRLRFAVYCSDLKWEDAARYPDGRELDEFDGDAVHCLLLHKRSGQYAGTVRLVRDRPGRSPQHRLPLCGHYPEGLFTSELTPLKLPEGTFGEISRLALHERFRRRKGEDTTPDGQGLELFEWTQDERRRFPHIALGLYLAAATVGLAEGLRGVFAMMEPRLARHLRYGGIYFEQVGAAVELRGSRAPFYISRTELFAHLTPPLRNLLKAIAQDLDLKLE